ncbi:MAG: hypothetical protein JNL71_11325 [Rhodospirillales bacterium]|nr:hypothetical protein [Rhodospirillales bacterium]
MTPAAFLDSVLAEQAKIFAAIPAGQVDRLCEALDSAKRVFVYGIGRNGLMLQGFAMRLAHLGIDAHFVGQLSAPPAAKGDVLVLAVALGTLPTADAVAAAARKAGARLAVVTARPAAVAHADTIVELKAQTMDDPPASTLPLGSAFELSLHLLCEHVTVELMRRRKLDGAALRARHANLL